MRAIDVLLVVACLVTAACSSRTGPFNPFSGTPASVVRATVRGPYIDAQLKGDADVRLLVPASETCARILRPEAQVEYWARGPWGEVRSGEETCTPLGVGDLSAWRDRKPRFQESTPVPSSRADFEILHEDEEVVLARGRFLLANRIGFINTGDLVAMIPNTETCREAMEDGEDTLLFRPIGREAFTLMVEGGSCPIAGFAAPP
jgi:hypothetical protein